MNDLSPDEAHLIQIIRDLKQFETIELKRDDKAQIVYIFTQKNKFTFLTKKTA